jgi:RNA polymerase sigma factor (sigma-70 family)
MAGDQQAWDELVRGHRPQLRTIAHSFRLNAADAEDAIQMTWLSLLQHVGKLRSHDQVGAWLNTTMRRCCLRIVQHRLWESLNDEALPATSDNAAAVVEMLTRAEWGRQLWNAVERLPGRQAQLVRALFDDQERSYQEIASAMSMPVGAIGPVRGRALRRLGKLLAESGISHENLRLPA